jgi:hypothetical protein
VCAAASHTGTVPIDVVKTRMQLEPERFKAQSFVEVARSIVAEEGVQGLASGAVPTFMGYAIQGSLKYGLFEALKPLLLATDLGRSCYPRCDRADEATGRVSLIFQGATIKTNPPQDPGTAALGRHG